MDFLWMLFEHISIRNDNGIDMDDIESMSISLIEKLYWKWENDLKNKNYVNWIATKLLEKLKIYRIKVIPLKLNIID